MIRRAVEHPPQVLRAVTAGNRWLLSLRQNGPRDRRTKLFEDDFTADLEELRQAGMAREAHQIDRVFCRRAEFLERQWREMGPTEPVVEKSRLRLWLEWMMGKV